MPAPFVPDTLVGARPAKGELGADKNETAAPRLFWFRIARVELGIAGRSYLAGIAETGFALSVGFLLAPRRPLWVSAVTPA